MKQKIALIDGDALVYQAASSNNGREYEWEEGLTSRSDPDFPSARLHLDQHVEKICDALNGASPVLCLSNYDSPWRKAIMPSYKANRKELPRPQLIEPLRAHIRSKYKSYDKPGLEGDDILGILLTHPTIIKGDKWCVSCDKDMKTIPGQHFNPGRFFSLRDTLQFTISPKEADYNHMFQTLTGDRVDGYPGCPKVGPKRAHDILAPCNGIMEMWLCTIGAFVDALGDFQRGHEEALKNAQVARIARACDYDFNRKQVIPWVGPK